MNTTILEDELLFLLDECVHAFETEVKGRNYWLLLERWKFGTADAKYLRNLNALTIEAGWGAILEVDGNRRMITSPSGTQCEYVRSPSSYSHDHIAATKFFHAVVAWRDRRVTELNLKPASDSGRKRPGPVKGKVKRSRAELEAKRLYLQGMKAPEIDVVLKKVKGQPFIASRLGRI